MALDDVNFNEGDGQDFIVEIPTETSHSALDILFETDGACLILETPLITPGAGGETSHVFVS
jgi:hypothetical protein